MKKMDGRKLKYDVLTEFRKRAVARVHSGESPEVVIRAMGFTRACIYNWLAMYRAGGWDALDARKRGGRPRKLNGRIIRWVYRVVVGSDPRQYKFPFALWTRKAIRTLIYRRYHIRVSANSVGRLLAQLGITPQRPLRRASEQDPVQVRQCLEEKYPMIRKRAQKRHHYIVFIDESGFMLNPLVRRTWAPRGQTPVIKVSEPHGRISVIGAITISPERSHFGFYFHLLEDNANFHGNSVAQFIADVYQKIRSPITLLWDAIPIHRAKPVESYLAKHPTIVVEPFPPYAPELNPVDNVWSYVKYDRLPNYALLDLRGLRRRITAEFCRLQERPDLLESFFKRTGLTLDPR
jgi:transposase